MNDNSFKMFFMVWSIIQDWDVPEFHWTVCDWLEDYKNWDRKAGVLQMARDHAKSTIVDLWIVWLLVKDPTLRIQVNSADDDTAERTVRDCQNIIMRHPLATHLADSKLWGARRFSVAGATDGRNPSVAAYGIQSNRTSSRADLIICDDVEVPKNSRDRKNINRMWENLMEIPHILIPGTGRELWVGTPHSADSIYPRMVAEGASQLFFPGMSEAKGKFPEMTGKAIWPNRFTAEVIFDLQQKINRRPDGKAQRPTKGYFMSQFLLVPTKTEAEVLDTSGLKYYDDEVTFTRSRGKLYARLGDTQLVSVSCFFDPSRSDKNDASVAALVYTDEDGNLYVHRCYEVYGDMDEQCDMLKEFLLEYHIPMINVETNGCGAFFPSRLLKITTGTGIGVIEIHSSTNKQTRIMEAFEQPLLGKFLHISQKVKNSKFIIQLNEFNPVSRSQEDDYINSVADAIHEQPIRIGLGGQAGDIKVDGSWMHSKRDDEQGFDIELEGFSHDRSEPKRRGWSPR